MRPLLPLALALLAACGDPEDSGTPAGDTGDEVPADTFCADEGFSVRAWQDGGTDFDYDTLVPDVTIPTLDGDIVLSEAWNGCDVWVFLPVDTAANSPVGLDRTADIRDWLELAPRNARWVILSRASGADNVDAEIADVKERVENALDNIGDSDAALADHLRGRIHYVDQGIRGLDGFGDFYSLWQRTMTGWVIDRQQKIREPGSWADPVTGWAESPAFFLNYDVEAANHQADLEDRIAAETDADVLRLFDAQAVSGYADVDVALPADMSAWDTLEADLTFACGGHPDGQYCGEWDYIAYLYLCDEDDPATDTDERETCSTEVGRWITTYARPGRWMHDVTPFLALLQDGGTRRFRIVPANSYVVTLDLRFSNQGKPDRPFAAEFLWTGGGFDENYSDAHLPHAFTPPEGTTRVEVVAVTTGHGFGADTENCAEFCNHQHRFAVNGGQEAMQEFTEVGDTYGCAAQVPDGTVAGQYGTWVYGRGGWCPGKQVDVWSADLTADTDLSGENVITYTATMDGEPFVPDYDVPNSTYFTGRIDLVSYLVYYK